jgi:hypothetical protein
MHDLRMNRLLTVLSLCTAGLSLLGATARSGSGRQPADRIE